MIFVKDKYSVQLCYLKILHYRCSCRYLKCVYDEIYNFVFYQRFFNLLENTLILQIFWGLNFLSLISLYWDFYLWLLFLELLKCIYRSLCLIKIKHNVNTQNSYKSEKLQLYQFFPPFYPTVGFNFFHMNIVFKNKHYITSSDCGHILNQCPQFSLRNMMAKMFHLSLAPNEIHLGKH